MYYIIYFQDDKKVTTPLDETKTTEEGKGTAEEPEEDAEGEGFELFAFWVIFFDYFVA